jgi:uncharacterized membrane protein
MPSRFAIALIGSLALNAALVGIVVGRWLTPKPDAQAAQMQLERYGPTSDVVKAAWDQLPEADQKDLGNQLREYWVAMKDERRRLSEAGHTVYSAALADPYDEAKLRDAVAIFQMREKKLQSIAEDILISHMESMPPQARATAAAGLLTPFNARMQRVDNADPGARLPPEEAPPPAPANQ